MTIEQVIRVLEKWIETDEKEIADRKYLGYPTKYFEGARDTEKMLLDEIRKAEKAPWEE